MGGGVTVATFSYFVHIRLHSPPRHLRMFERGYAILYSLVREEVGARRQLTFSRPAPPYPSLRCLRDLDTWEQSREAGVRASLVVIPGSIVVSL